MFEDIVTDNGELIMSDRVGDGQLVTDRILGDPSHTGELIGSVSVYPAIGSGELPSFKRVDP